MAALLLASMLVTACGGPKDNSEFVVGLVLVGPYNDHGWSEAHYQAGKYVEEKVPGAKMIYLDKLNPADRKGMTLEQVVDDMVSQGAKLIVTTSDDFAADTDVVAAKYPDLPFVHISGDHAKTGKAPKNVANVMSQMEYMKAVAGCAAALKTETGIVGYLGPLTNDETRRLASAAYLGCRDCYQRFRGKNPDDLRFVVTWIGFWFNIPGVTLDPTEVANDMYNQGADVVLSGIDTTEAIVVAGQRKDRGENVWAIQYDYEGACEIKPEVCLGVPYFNWGPTYLELVKQVKAGKFEQSFTWQEPYWKDINDHDKSPVGFAYGPALSDADKTNLDAYIKDLASGKVKLFSGPLYLQDGSMYIEAGKVATPDQIWYLPQLLRGMEGASF
jgi:simple sugar transport system substrate-binding protein